MRNVNKNEISYGEKERENKMEMLEKIDKLRERANVSYEEAKEALEASDGDLLDAMIYLERQGKVKAEKEVHTTEYTTEDAKLELACVDNKDKADGKDFGEKCKRFFKKLWEYLSDNRLKISHHDNELIDLPLWVVLIILIAGWWAVLVLIVVSLFFDWNYSFYGKNDMKTANDLAGKAKETAEHVKDEFNK